MDQTAKPLTAFGFRVMVNPNIPAGAFAVGYPGKPFLLSTGGTMEWSQVNKSDSFAPFYWPLEDTQ